MPGGILTYWTLDSLVVSTWTHLLEAANIAGGVLPGRRWKPTYVAGRDGAYPDFEAPLAEKVLRLPITLLPVGSTGVVTNSRGWAGHLVANRNDLFRVIGKRGPIDVAWRMPIHQVDPLEDPAYVVVGGRGLVVSEITVGAARRSLWDALVDVTIPAGVLTEAATTVTAAQAGSITVGGSAPVSDIVLTFAGDGTWSDGTTSIVIAGSTGPVVVDCGARTITQAGQLAGHLATLTGAERWPVWAAGSTVAWTSTVNVGIVWRRAWH